MKSFRSEWEKIVYDRKYQCLLSEEQIQNRVRQLGKQLSEDYRHKNPIMIGVLNGGFMFMADLIRNMEIDLEIDFIKVSSYGNAKISSGQVRILKDIDADVKGRHILLVEDIVDTGLSVQFLSSKLQRLEPESLEFVSLLFKKMHVQFAYPIKYVGFNIPNDYVVGYGLDYKQILRNLPSIFVMD